MLQVEGFEVVKCAKRSKNDRALFGVETRPLYLKYFDSTSCIDSQW